MRWIDGVRAAAGVSPRGRAGRLRPGRRARPGQSHQESELGGLKRTRSMTQLQSRTVLRGPLRRLTTFNNFSCVSSCLAPLFPNNGQRAFFLDLSILELLSSCDERRGFGSPGRPPARSLSPFSQCGLEPQPSALHDYD